MQIQPYVFFDANAVLQAMMQMGKLDIARLQQACDRHGRYQVHCVLCCAG